MDMRVPSCPVTRPWTATRSLPWRPAPNRAAQTPGLWACSLPTSSPKPSCVRSVRRTVFRESLQLEIFHSLSTFYFLLATYSGGGAPSVPDHIAVWELILPLRQRFDQYVNLRPMRLFPGVSSPLANRGP